jgi:hypothetical protein
MASIEFHARSSKDNGPDYSARSSENVCDLSVHAVMDAPQKEQLKSIRDKESPDTDDFAPFI